MTPAFRPKPFHVSRRSFLKRCSVAAAATGLPLWFLERELAAAEDTRSAHPSPNDRPGVALIGCGGQGKGDASNAANHGDIVAVCDVDEKRRDEAVKKFTVDGKAPRAFDDFRRVLERDDVDVIVNATPDHWHTLINIAAARAKKDVYSEKPLTLTIDEGHHLIKAVRQNKIVLQTGTQQRSSQRFRLACELVRNQRIGKLKEANVWIPAGRREGPFVTSPVPPELNWDYWQGQAPATDYIKERCHQRFRFWYEYSGGIMTDWGAHHNDIAYWAVGIVAPRDVEATSHIDPIPGGFTTHSEFTVRYNYDNGLPLTVRTTPDDNPSGGVINKGGQRNGIRFEGEDGWIWINRDRIAACDPQILRTPLPEDAVRLYNSPNHMLNFFDCVRSRKDPICTAEIGHRSATMCHLGAIALRTGFKLRWDGERERFIGDHADVANTYLAREMRKPYDYGFVS